MKYIIHLSEPWFSLVLLGLKIVEGRKNKGIFKEINIGDIIEWENSDFGCRTILTEIITKNEYGSFREYLENEGLEKCLPSIENIENGLNVYYKYYTKEDEKIYGVIALHMRLIK